MRAEIIRYLIGVALGIAIGALATWRWAHDDASRILADWERAVQIQNEAERRRHARLFEDTTRGILADRARLWERMADGWRPAIPAAPGMPARGIPGPAAGTDATPAAGLPAAAGTEADTERLKICDAQRNRLIADGQETMLRCQRLQGFVEGVRRPKTPRTKP